MADWVTKELSDYISKLKKKFGNTYAYPEFWDYVVRMLASDPNLMLGDPSYQSTRVHSLYTKWANDVNSGKLPRPAGVDQPQVAPPEAPPSDVAPKGIGQPQVVSQGGYDWYPYIDPTTGETVSWELIGKTPSPNEPSWLQQEQMGLSREQFDWQKQQAAREMELQRLGAQSDIAQQQVAWLSNISRSRPDTSKIAQEALAKEWENMRAQIMEQVQASPRDWINAYRASAMANPYKPTNSWTTADEMRSLQEDLKVAKSAEQVAKDLENRYPSGGVPSNVQVSINDAKQRVTRIEEKLSEVNREFSYGKELAQSGGGLGEIREEYGREPTEAEKSGYAVAMGISGDGEGSKPVKQPTMPEIPSWLQAVSGLTGRVPTTRTEVSRPSAQAWTQLLPGQREMYAGLVDWAGQVPYTDKLDIMQKTIPQSPSLGRSWATARQV